MHPAFPPDAAPLEIDRTEWVPSSAQAVHLHVYGRWRDRPVAETLVLLVGDRGRRHGFPARPESPAGVFASFAVPNELRPALAVDIALQIGAGELPLPAATAGAVVEAQPDPPGEVIDRAVLAERRARRAELGEEALTRRAEAAEQTAATLQAQLGNLEQRLEQAREEHTELEARAAEAEDRRRAAEEHGYAEQQQRIGAQDELGVTRQAHHAELAELRGRCAAAEQRVEELTHELGAARRVASEVVRTADAPVLPGAVPDGADQEARIRRLEADLAAALAPAHGVRERKGDLRRRKETAEREVASLRHALLARTEQLERAASQLERALRAGERARAEGERQRGALEQARAMLAVVRPVTGELAQAVEAERAERIRQFAEVHEQFAALREHLDRARTGDAERAARDVQVQRLVAEVLRTSAALRERFEAEIRELERQLTERIVAERREAAAEVEGLETELATLRAELERLRALTVAPADRLAGGLEAAAGRLREQTAPLGEDAELDAPPAPVAAPPEVLRALREAMDELTRPHVGSPAGERALAPRPVAETEDPEPPAPSTAVLAPLARPVPPELLRPWLAPAIARVAARHPERAAALIVGLLGVRRRPGRRDVTYDVTIEDGGSYRVSMRDGATAVEPIPPSEKGRDVDFSVAGPPAPLGELVAGAPGKRPRGVRVSGRRRRLRALLRRRGVLQLADVLASGARVEPGLLLAALAAAVDPAWTSSRRFTVAWHVGGEGAEPWYVTVRPGTVPEALPGAPAEPPAATVEASSEAFLTLLAGAAPAPGDEVRVVGDEHAAITLVRWLHRVQGLL